MDQKDDWRQDVGYATRSQFKKFNKIHPAEFQSCFANLDKLTVMLNAGHTIGSFHLGFFRSESGGLYRVGQTGVVSAKESRLYIYPVEARRLIYILGIGTKETQQADIRNAKKCIKKIKTSG